MVDARRDEVVKWGPFELGRSYDEVEPTLGRLHEARHVNTGRAALAFLLTERVSWTPEGEWDVRLSFGPSRASVMVRVEDSPASASPTELTDAFTQVTAALTRVEGNDALRAHLARGTVPPWRRWAGWGLAGLAVLALGLGLWRGAAHASELVSRPFRDGSQKESWATNEAHVDPSPTKQSEALPPARNQKRAPCTKGLELEVSGLCWVSVVQRPCPEQTEPYAGQCLLPVAAPSRVPSSVDTRGPEKP